MSKCQGCGIVLQHEHPDRLGYSPKKDALYCKRCFRISHYGDVTFDMKKGIDPVDILSKVNKMNCLVVWVVDLFDFEASLMDSLNRHLYNKEIVVVLTKKDLIPATIGDDKLAKFVKKRFEYYGLHVVDVVYTGFNYDSVGVKDTISKHSQNREVVVLGMTNVGKSTMLNSLMNTQTLTASIYPGTTLDFNELKIDGVTYMDTPGLENNQSMIMYLNKDSDANYIIPHKLIKPIGFQTQKEQSFSIEGLCRIDFFGLDKTSIVFYKSNELTIHRGKVSNAQQYWLNQDFKIKLNIDSSEYKETTFSYQGNCDVVIAGLGFISVKGPYTTIKVYTHPNVKVLQREVML